MSIRTKLLLAFSIVLALAAGVAGYGIRAVSNADGLVVRLYEQPFMAVSYARSAQVQFCLCACSDGAQIFAARCGTTV